MALGMPPDNIPSTSLDSAIAKFREGASRAASEDVLLLPHWRDEDWVQLFLFASIRRVSAGEALIRQGEPGRTLYFILSGKLEVYALSSDGITLGPVATVGAGSVLGEQAFFDSGPRSASTWAVEECEVAALAADQFAAFEKESPALARDLLFALGSVLSIRLRKTTSNPTTDTGASRHTHRCRADLASGSQPRQHPLDWQAEPPYLGSGPLIRVPRFRQHGYPSSPSPTQLRASYETY